MLRAETDDIVSVAVPVEISRSQIFWGRVGSAITIYHDYRHSTHVLPSPAVVSTSMETPDFRQVALQHYTPFRTLAEAHWSAFLIPVEMPVGALSVATRICTLVAYAISLPYLSPYWVRFMLYVYKY